MTKLDGHGYRGDWGGAWTISVLLYWWNGDFDRNIGRQLRSLWYPGTIIFPLLLTYAMIHFDNCVCSRHSMSTNLEYKIRLYYEIFLSFIKFYEVSFAYIRELADLVLWRTDSTNRVNLWRSPSIFISFGLSLQWTQSTTIARSNSSNFYPILTKISSNPASLLHAANAEITLIWGHMASCYVPLNIKADIS